MKKTGIVLFAMIIMGVIPSLMSSCCLTDSCGCGTYDPGEYTLLDFNVLTLDDGYDLVDPVNQLTYDSVFKVIQISDFTLSMNTPEFTGFIPAAYACSPAPPTTKNPVREIRIISESEFQMNTMFDQIEIGQDITSRFVIGEAFSNDFSPVNSREPYLEYIGDYWQRIRLAQAPFQSIEFQFTITIELTDGKFFEFSQQSLAISGE